MVLRAYKLHVDCYGVLLCACYDSDTLVIKPCLSLSDGDLILLRLS